MGVTPLLQLPYPEPADLADVPKDVKALADRLDIGPSTIVTALPASPVDGQQVNYLADAANGVVWRLRYRAGSSSPYKWELVGGSPLTSEVAASEAVAASGAWGPATTAGPQVTLPLAGDYIADVSAGLSSGQANVFTQTGLRYGGAGGVAAADLARTMNIFNGQSVMVSRTGMRRNALTAGMLVTQLYFVQTGTLTVATRNMSILPIRVG